MQPHQGRPATCSHPGSETLLSEQDRQPWAPPVPRERPQKVAIVGAGPAGLTAAFFLRSAGFRVTLYDKESAPGGLMRFAIPEFRLPREVLDRDLGFLKTMKVEFLGNHTLGKDLDPAKLENDYDAVLLAVGAYGKTGLGIPGESGDAVFPVLEFMRNVRESRPPKVGERVIVIGGGNAAVDACQTALRLGAKEVTLVCLEKREEMPAFSWSVSEAEEEGVKIVTGWGPQRFRYDGKNLRGVIFKNASPYGTQWGASLRPMTRVTPWTFPRIRSSWPSARRPIRVSWIIP